MGAMAVSFAPALEAGALVGRAKKQVRAEEISQQSEACLF